MAGDENRPGTDAMSGLDVALGVADHGRLAEINLRVQDTSLLEQSNIRFTTIAASREVIADLNLADPTSSCLNLGAEVRVDLSEHGLIGDALGDTLMVGDHDNLDPRTGETCERLEAARKQIEIGERVDVLPFGSLAIYDAVTVDEDGPEPVHAAKPICSSTSSQIKWPTTA